MTPEERKKIKQGIAIVEVSGDMKHPNPYQLTRIVLKDIKRRYASQYPKIAQYQWKDVLIDRAKQDNLANAYLDVLEKMLPSNHHTPLDYIQAWYKPYLYRKIGYNIDSAPLHDRVVMQNRRKNYEDYLTKVGRR